MFLHYVIRGDRDWSTRSTHVAGWIGETPVEKRIEVDREGRFPAFRLEVLEQVYRRIADGTYRYESGGGAFVTTLEVDPAGFVTEYPGFFRAERRG